MTRPADIHPEESYPNVVCHGCKGQYHRVNDLFDPDGFCKGNMLVLLSKYKKARWSSFAETTDTYLNKMICPQCGTRYSDWDGKVQLSGELPPKPEVDDTEDWGDAVPMYLNINPTTYRRPVTTEVPQDVRRDLDKLTRKKRKPRKVKDARA